MKNKIQILTILFVTILGSTSCSDFLNPESPSEFYQDYIYSTTADAKKGLMGAYALFTADPYTSRMSNVWMQNTDVEAMGPTASPDGSRRDIWSLQAGLLTGFGDVYNAWQNCYQAIDRANQVIEGIQASAIKNDPEMQMMLGEAYCLRAYRYFMLCNFWGDVPYFDQAAKFGVELDKAKTDKNIIYSHEIQALVNCEENMYYANKFSDGVERMNRDFAIGMIARLSLFRAGYGMTKEGVMKRADEYLDVASNPDLAVTYTVDGVEKTARTSADYYELAKAYALKLVNNNPRTLDSFGKVFRNQCEWVSNNDSEVLFEVAFGTTNSGGDVGWCIGVTVSSSSKGATTIQTAFQPAYYFSFDNADLRRDVTCSLIGYSSDTQQGVVSVTEMTVGKWNRLLLKNNPGAESSKSTGINWPLMRYADVLLMLAEAENELNGPSELAKTALRTVRNRAFAVSDHAEKVDAYINNLTSKETFFNAIVDERAWEFGGECLRKFDLVRWNNYGKKIVETIQKIDNMGKAAWELDLENPEVAKYSNLANVIYYQRSGGTISFVNTVYKAENPPTAIVEDAAGTIDGDYYAEKSWTKALYRKVTATNGDVTYQSADYTVRSWRGYKDPTGVAAVPYLLPIGVSTLSSSKALNNEGYGHVFSAN
ncbi:MAG: RagB/SusD family nutrient uptake outer membrane protein [Paludibacter sp.]|jgi:hypothetical protein|nr:RagB/SusD family nutrient uptake outer membrane protein [Paludibacter sp.]